MSKIPETLLQKILQAKEQKSKEFDLSWKVGLKLTEIPSEVFELEQLQVLDLSSHSLTKIPADIARLRNLKSLNIKGNQLTNLPSALSSLTNLTSLNISYNQLTPLPENISSLTELTSLNISHNQLTTLPETIGLLTNLMLLDISFNQLTTLPETIGSLTKLTSLNISHNQLTTLPEIIGLLTNLMSLDISINQLITLPETIGSLANLISLDISNNRLITLPETIGSLTSLISLNVCNHDFSSSRTTNELTSLPETIGSLTNLKTLNVHGNSIETPPPEIVERGIDNIRNYLRQKRIEGVDHLSEAKLLIIGEGGAGKTTLSRKIKDSAYQLQDDEFSTEGIDVVQWEFLLSDSIQRQHGKKTFRVNIWDFGGQEIYHATHQFFLTKRSLYILVADTRKEDTDFYYWLNVVELLSDNSPVLIIKNEKQDRHREINERQLRGQFTNLEKILATNLATNRGLEEVIEQIKHIMSHLPHVGTELPKTWVRVRQALETEQDTRNYISLDEYLNICTQHGLTRQEDKLQLSGYLHDLGVCLHFQDDPLLNKTVILNPEWGTDAVYKVLDNKQVIRNLGQFTKANLADIWYEERYANMHDELLRLMMKFQLCYQIPDTHNTYISPQLLSENQPNYKWPNKRNLLLRYSYEFMPKGILTRFIVVMHTMIHKQKFVWKSGVVLKKDDTYAEVIEHYGKREIRINIYGKHKKELLTIVTHEIDRIHGSFHRLKYTKLIPCNCETCRDSQEPHFYAFDVLREFAANEQYKIQCQRKPFAMVNVQELINDGGLINMLGKDSINLSVSLQREIVDFLISLPTINDIRIVNEITYSNP